MMQKGLQEFQKTVYRVLILLAALQIVLGSLWALCNMGSVQAFSETQELLEISETLVTDEYVGILYPVMIRIFRIISSLLPVPYYCFLYVLQLGAGYFAVYRLLLALDCPHARRAAVWITTIPTVLQLHMAVLPQSLASSLLLLCVISCVRRKWIRGGVCWLLCGLLIPEYFLFAGMIYILNLIRELMNRDERSVAQGENAQSRNAVRSGNPAQSRSAAHSKKMALCKGLICLMLVCMAAGAVTSVTQRTYSRGRMARTPASVALQRLVWPHYSTNSYFWNVYVTDLFDEEALWDLAQDPQLPVREFGPAIEHAYGLEQAQVIYRYMAQITFQMRTKEILFDILNDLILYSIPTAALPRNLEGLGVSYSGWNYGRMAERAPVLTRFYVLFAGNAAGIMLLLVLLKKLAQGMNGRQKKSISGKAGKALSKDESARKTERENRDKGKDSRNKEKGGRKKERSGRKKERDSRDKDRRWLTAQYLLLCALQILWYTLSASGMQDYRNVVIVSAGWGILTVMGTFGRKNSVYEEG